MSNSVRLIAGIILGAVIFLMALYIVPEIGFIAKLTEIPAISNGEITQSTLLIISLILAYFLSGKKLSDFGFRMVNFKYLIRPIIISIAAVILFFIAMNISMAVLGMKPDEMGDSGIDKSILNFLITVALFASVCEEVFYRGLIYGFMKPLVKFKFKIFRLEMSLPVIVCALMFGVGHLCLLSRMNPAIVIGIVISATMLGLIAGYYREKTGSLMPAIAAHMTFNLIAFGIPTIMKSVQAMA